MILDVLPVVVAALQDPTTGLCARARELLVSRATPIAASKSVSLVRVADSDVAYIPWSLTGAMQGTAQHNVAVTPASWVGDFTSSIADYQQQTHRLTVGFETFATDNAQREATVLVYSAAAFMVLRRLQDYSAAHSGTIQEAQDVTMQLGTYAGAARSAVATGFQATVTLTEWSAV